MTSNDAYLKLLSLRNAAGSNLYERLKLADRLLADREWVSAPDCGGGDIGTAVDRLEADCFGDVVGILNLPQLGEILHHFPEEKDWKRLKYNVIKLYDATRAARQPARAPSRPSSPTSAGERTPAAAGAATAQPTEFTRQMGLLQQLRAEVAELRRQLAQASKERDEAVRENKRLRAKIKRITDEIAEVTA